MADFRQYVERVRAATDLEALLDARYHITVEAHQALCPFHPDSNPSMSTTDRLFHCFACDAGGDVFHLVMRLEPCAFLAAVDLLATLAGMTPQRQTAADRVAVAAARATEDLTEWATTYYQTRMTSEARSYLQEARGLPPAVTAVARCGWADGGLTAAVTLAGGAPEGLVVAGLAQEPKNQTTWVQSPPPHDWLQARVTFPALHQGRATFLSGRTLDPAMEPKYLHQRGRPAPLYQEDAVGPDVIVVEGQVDALSLTAWGFPTVGLLGTPHAAHLEALRRPPRVYLCLDTDRAGQAAMIKLAAGLGLERTRIIRLPPACKDPNDFYRTQPRAAFEALVDAACDPVVAVLEAVPFPAPNATALAPLFTLLAAVDPVEVQHYFDGPITTWARGRRAHVKAVAEAWAGQAQAPRYCPTCHALLP